MKKAGFVLCAACVLLPWVPAPAALIAGMLYAWLWGNPYASVTKTYTPKLMAYAIVGLGASMNIYEVLQAGSSGFAYTCLGIVLTLYAGHVLTRFMGCNKHMGLLLASGTAICGGSAIAAVSSATNAKHHDTSVALATVFFLNACALCVFPWVGHVFHLTPTQFGVWSALAIHDTSSVVGAALSYHKDSVQIATTLKLARALWIIPLTWWASRMYNTGTHSAKKPWFILGFLGSAVLFTCVPALKPLGGLLYVCAKRCMVLTLFLVGSGLTQKTLKDVGFKPLLLGWALWIFSAATSLLGILTGFVAF